MIEECSFCGEAVCDHTPLRRADIADLRREMLFRGWLCVRAPETAAVSYERLK